MLFRSFYNPLIRNNKMNSDKIENTVKDTNTNKAGDNTTMVCPNCGGTMRRQNKMWICESCDHEMPVKVDY